MMQKSRVQEMFPLKWSRWGWYLVYAVHCFVVLFISFFLISATAGLLHFWSSDTFKMIFMICLFMGLAGSLLAAYVGANRFMREYYFDVTDDAILVTFAPVQMPFRWATDSLTIPFGEIEEITLEGESVKIVTHKNMFSHPVWFLRESKSKGPVNYFSLGSFDAHVGRKLADYIIEKLLKKGGHVLHKSKVQEMFPRLSQSSDNSTEENYFFDITDHSVVVIEAEKNRFVRRHILLSKIEKVKVKRAWFGDAYYVEIGGEFWPYKIISISSFDEKIAQALREYIIDKAKQAKPYSSLW